jgi:4-diphosphocytidyl-2-C-methyl-D-erythritol kinase
VRRLPAPAKLNLALVVGPRRGDGKHEVATVLQAVDLADRIALAPAPELRVTGFAGDALVARALRLLAEAARVDARFAAHIDKRIPVASGLGGGSSDAATALRLANATLDRPLPDDELERLARELGADVPFFLRPGPKLGEGDGTTLTPLDLPQDYWVVVVAPRDESKPSTRAVYDAFDARGGPAGYETRRDALRGALERLRRARDLAGLPRNDLASSPLAAELEALGAFRADVTGAGPAVYGLFHHRSRADAAAARLRTRGRVWVTVPAWYV